MNGFNAFGAQVGGSRPAKQQDVSSLLRDVAPLGSRAAANANDFSPERLAEIAENERRWSWVEVDLGAIRNNIAVAKRRLKPGCRLLAVVKADAYGHGRLRLRKPHFLPAPPILRWRRCKKALSCARRALPRPCSCFPSPPEAAIPLLLNYNIMPSVYTAEFAVAYGEAADAHGLRAPFHLALNTGMNRIGVRFDEAVEFVRQISFHRALEHVGTFTHFATADCPETLDFNMQFRRFTEAISDMRVAGINPGIVHCANSAALLRYPDTHLDMARFGISLYGFHPCPETVGYFDLRPAMSVHARITNVSQPPMSEGVSYGLHYRSTGSVKICTLPIGYADGYNRALSSRTQVIYNGQLCNQVGNICMDQCMFEIDMRSSGTRPRLDPANWRRGAACGRPGWCAHLNRRHGGTNRNHSA